MRIAIHQPYYMPWCGYMNKMASVDEFVYLDKAQFTKGGYFNRTMILIQGRCHWLTIPVVYEMGQQIQDVKTSGTKWLNKHVKTVEQAYAKSPHLADFMGSERDLPYEVHADLNLPDLTISLVDWFARELHINTPTVLESELKDLDPAAIQTDRLVEICKIRGADEYVAGSGGSTKYLDLGKMADAGIKVLWQKVTMTPYKQRNTIEFIPGLSVVDMICNMGIRHTESYVKNCGQVEVAR